MADTNYNEFIENLVNAGTAEDDIYTALAAETGKGILNAVNIYKKWLKETGRVMTPDQKKEKTNALVEAAIVDGELSGDKADLVKAVGDALGVSSSTAVAHVNKALAAKGIEVASGNAPGEVNQWLIDHPNATRKEFAKFMEDTGRKASTTSAYWSAFLFAHACHKVWPAHEASAETTA